MVNPDEPADKYIQSSDCIVGIGPGSTALFTAHLHMPHIQIVSIDFGHELFGDAFKGYSGIEYIDEESKLTQRI